MESKLVSFDSCVAVCLKLFYPTVNREWTTSHLQLLLRAIFPLPLGGEWDEPG